MLTERRKYFDVDTRPEGPIPAEKPVRATKVGRRRRYSHTFSAGRKFKIVRGANGQNRWRRLPDSAIVHYGKQQLRTKGKSYEFK